jgi:hypothetical protein
VRAHIAACRFHEIPTGSPRDPLHPDLLHAGLPFLAPCLESPRNLCREEISGKPYLDELSISNGTGTGEHRLPRPFRCMRYLKSERGGHAAQRQPGEVAALLVFAS